MPEKRKTSKKKVLKENEYERTNGSYEYRYRDENGKRHSLYAKTLDELREKELGITRKVSLGVRLSDNPTLDELYERWIALKSSVRETTLNNYRAVYTNYAHNVLGSQFVTKIANSDIKLLYVNLYKENYHPATIHMLHGVLHQVFETAKSDGIIFLNPTNGATRVLGKPKTKTNVATREKIISNTQQKVLETVLNDGKHDILLFMLYTGLRVGEATGLTWQDVNFANNTMTIQRTLLYGRYDEHQGRCSFRIHEPKTESSKRVIPLLPQARQVLERIHAKEKKNVLFIDGILDFVFLTRANKPYVVSILNRTLASVSQKCDEIMRQNNLGTFPRISCHTLRHSFATRAIEHGVNPKTVQHILGHSKLDMTMNVYVDPDRDFDTTEIMKLTTNLPPNAVDLRRLE